VVQGPRFNPQRPKRGGKKFIGLMKPNLPGFVSCILGGILKILLLCFLRVLCFYIEATHLF
jgi:hypothetical protein